MTTEEKLNHLTDYLNHRVDIICQNPNRWMKRVNQDGYINSSYYNLPTFEYYIRNCVKDKDGAYDFTKRRYETGSQALEPIKIANFHKIIGGSSIYRRKIIYSDWMGTPFNFKEVSSNGL